MGDSDRENDEASSFFDALPDTSNGPSKIPAKPMASPTPFDDGGEPDFAGWLNAQAAAKTKPPLPKGLKSPAVKSPTGTAKGVNRKGIPARPAVGAKSVTSPAAVVGKEISTKPKDEGDEEGDGWGAWD